MRRRISTSQRNSRTEFSFHWQPLELSPWKREIKLNLKEMCQQSVTIELPICVHFTLLVLAAAFHSLSRKVPACSEYGNSSSVLEQKTKERGSLARLDAFFAVEQNRNKLFHYDHSEIALFEDLVWEGVAKTCRVLILLSLMQKE